MRSDFEERRERRIGRAEELAEKNKNLSKSLFEKSGKMAEVIPFGQPILVGHHSEKADRNYRNKIQNKMSKSVEAGNKLY